MHIGGEIWGIARLAWGGQYVRVRQVAFIVTAVITTIKYKERQHYHQLLQAFLPPLRWGMSGTIQGTYSPWLLCSRSANVTTPCQ